MIAADWTGSAKRAGDRAASTLQRLKLASEAKGYDVMVTGHSLGGLLATIAAAKCNVPVVTFSAPGQLYNARRLGIDKNKVAASVVNVNADGDIVPYADSQLGMAQNIRCSATNALACHMPRVIGCDLYRACGDPRGRLLEEARCS